MNKATRRIQRVEICSHEVPIHCPFCGTRTYSPDLGEAPSLEACEHLLFMAHDEGFEFRSPEFDENRGIKGISEDDIDRPEHGFDGLTDQVDIPDSVKFAFYQPAPSFMGTYFGYAPKA